MKTLWLMAPLLGTPLAWSQTFTSPAAPSPPVQDSRAGLQRVDDQDSSPEAPGDAPDEAQPAFEAERWREKLTDEDLDAREEALDHLLKLARRDKRARQAIADWADGVGHDDTELAWTARLMRRQLDTRNVYRFRNVPQAFRTQPFGIEGPFEVDFDQLERRLRSLDTTFGVVGTDFDRFMTRWGLTPPGAPPVPGAPGAPGLPGARSQSFNLEVGSDGVTCKVKSVVDGEEQTQEYKADSLEELYANYPELRQITEQGGGVGRWTAGTQGLEDLLRDLRQNRGLFGNTPAPIPGHVPTDILGIEFRKRLDDEGRQPGVDAGVGLKVERTVPGTIAHILGIKRGDILLELNCIQLVDGDDVSEALARRKPNEPIVVEMIDGRGQRRTLTWKPTVAETDAEAEEWESRDF